MQTQSPYDSKHMFCLEKTQAVHALLTHVMYLVCENRDAAGEM